ncbi:MAG: methanogenesis marker 14 protein [Methanosarcinales archaeon]
MSHNCFRSLLYKPRIAESPYLKILDLKYKPRHIVKSNPYFVVASVEVGNTTTKCILTATNLKDGKTSIVNKTVKMTRDVRMPKYGEKIFGKTLSGIPLTEASIAELVRDTLIEACNSANIDLKEDLHFVVRSTGVVAGFASPDEIGIFIKALANGCLLAGVPPRRMTPAMSLLNIPEKLREYSNIEKVEFDGAVGGVVPPIGSTGVEIVANEMEGELATAGIKEGAKWSYVDFRNPCLSLDFGTTLDGRITNEDSPYAKTIGNFCGYAGEIPDSIVQGTGLVDKNIGNALDLYKGSKNVWTILRKCKIIKEYVKDINQYIKIEKVPDDRDRYGSVPVNPKAAKKNGVVLIGCDVGVNGSDLFNLKKIGRDIYKKHGLKTVFATIDMVMAKVTFRLIKVAKDYNLITDKTSIGITGRAGITGNKPKLILFYLDKLKLFKNPEEHVVFVDDGLARGAAVMARCMNSLGTPKNPVGGLSGDSCLLGKRMKLQKKRFR